MNWIVRGLIGLIVCAGLFLIGRSLLQMSKKEIPADHRAVLQELHRVRTADYEILKSGKGSEEDIAKALRRYSAQNLSGSEVYVKHYLNDPRPVVYSAALECSGAFSWTSLADFQAAFQSSDEKVQKAALAGLAKRSDEDRIQLIEEFLKSARSPDVRFEGLLALHKMTSSADKKANLEAQMISLADNLSADAQPKLLIKLLGISIRTPRLVEQARGWVRSTASDELAGKSLQYLAFHQLDWVTANLSKLPVREHPYYQNVVLDILRSACVQEWATLEIALRQKATQEKIKAELESLDLPRRCRNK